MSTSLEARPNSTVAGALPLWGTSTWRLLRSRQTVICALLMVLASAVAMVWRIREHPEPREFVESIILPLYLSFLLPIYCLCYAAPSIAGDREEGTLVYLLASPLARPLVYAAKFAASLTCSLIWSWGTLQLLAYVGEIPSSVNLTPGVIAATVAYVSLFHLFSVLFRRATIVALGYWLFLETFVANVPGIAKRVAVSFYTHCVVFAAAEPLGVPPAGNHPVEIYQPIAGPTALWCLIGISAALFLFGAYRFARAEYS